MKDLKEAEKLARKFHDTYERLAPSYGYETRKDTRKFDPTSANGKLMIAVCRELLSQKQVKVEGDEKQNKLPPSVEERFNKKFTRRNKQTGKFEDGWFVIETTRAKDIKAFLSEELANQKKEMIERIEKIRKIDIGKESGDYVESESSFRYNQALDDIIQALNK